MCILELTKHSIQIEGWQLKKAGYVVNFLFFLAGSSLEEQLIGTHLIGTVLEHCHGLLSLPCLPGPCQ